jgi:hypothetical protein
MKIITEERLKELEACEELLMQVLDDHSMHEDYDNLYPELYALAMGDSPIAEDEAEEDEEAAS